MIDERKLLCAFIYSAYESGYCGLALGPEKREAHKNLYREFISEQGRYPEEEIAATQGKMMEKVSVSGIRDYVYRGHLDIVISRIEQETGKNFDEMMKSPVIRSVALACPVNFYRVVSIGEGSVTAEHLFFGSRRNLVVLEGLERPKVGDTISGHWNFLLETVDEIPELERYQEISRNYMERIRKATA